MRRRSASASRSSRRRSSRSSRPPPKHGCCRRGARADQPIRKFALQLVVEPVSGNGPSGKTTVTAFLRPQAQLVDVWTLPGGEAAIARISYTGIPSGLGLDKDTVVLLTSGLYSIDENPESAE